VVLPGPDVGGVHRRPRAVSTTGLAAALRTLGGVLTSMAARPPSE